MLLHENQQQFRLHFNDLLSVFQASKLAIKWSTAYWFSDPLTFFFSIRYRVPWAVCLLEQIELELATCSSVWESIRTNRYRKCDCVSSITTKFYVTVFFSHANLINVFRWYRSSFNTYKWWRLTELYASRPTTLNHKADIQIPRLILCMRTICFSGLARSYQIEPICEKEISQH